MAYYSPVQVNLLKWIAAYHPDQLAAYRAAFSQVQPITDQSIQDQATAAKNQYLADQVNPIFAKQMVADGPNASSFAAARQAEILANGSAQAQQVYNNAYNNSANSLTSLRAAQQQQEQAAWNDLFSSTGPLFGSGGLGSNGVTTLNGQQATGGGWQNMAARAATGLYQLGKNYVNATNNGFNLGNYAQGAGRAVANIGSVPGQFLNGLFGQSQKPASTPINPNPNRISSSYLQDIGSSAADVL